MKRKEILERMLLMLLAASIFFFPYIELRRDINKQNIGVRTRVFSYLDSSLTFAYRTDINKLSAGDKESISSLVNMHREISRSQSVLTMEFDILDCPIDPGDMMEYERALNDLITKAAKGEMKDGDVEKFNIVNEDVRLMYEYLKDNEKADYNKYMTEIRPKLRLINSGGK